MPEQGLRPRRGRPPLGDRRRDLTRLDISRVAVRLFREQGPAATGGEQIAAAVGISVRTLWRYFPSKEACVEPLLAQTLDAYIAALRRWPADRTLEEHLIDTYALPPDSDPEDAPAIQDLLRMTRDEPGIRAVWLVLHDRAEPVLAEMLAARYGLPPDTLEVRVQAAALNSAQRLAVEEVAWAGASLDVRGPHRERLTRAVAAVTRGVGVRPDVPPAG